MTPDFISSDQCIVKKKIYFWGSNFRFLHVFKSFKSKKFRWLVSVPVCYLLNSKSNYSWKDKFGIFNWHHIEELLETFCEIRLIVCLRAIQNYSNTWWSIRKFFVNNIKKLVLTFLRFMFLNRLLIHKGIQFRCCF